MPPSPSPSPTLNPAIPGRMSPRAALWLLASIMVGYLAASSAPSPLYALYRHAWGFSALTLTVVFASYAITLLAALLVFGTLSDHRGRREVVLIAMLLEIGSLLLFWSADSVGMLLAARSLQGVATGIATGVLSAALIDIDRGRGALVNSVAPMIGMAVGALGSSLLVEYAPAPTRLVYEVLLGIFALQTVLALRLPETVLVRKPEVWRSLRPRIAIPPQARATLLQMLPVNTAAWALGGFYLSLGPTLARTVTGNDAPTTGGAAILALVLSAAFAILFVRDVAPRRTLLGGAVVLAVGLALTLVAIDRAASVLFFLGTAIAGVGFGTGFNGALRSLVSLALPEQRGGLMSGFYVLSYLAFSLPAIAAGFAVGIFGLHATALAFGAALMALTLLALALMIRRGT